LRIRNAYNAVDCSRGGHGVRGGDVGEVHMALFKWANNNGREPRNAIDEWSWHESLTEVSCSPQRGVSL